MGLVKGLSNKNMTLYGREQRSDILNQVSPTMTFNEAKKCLR